MQTFLPYANYERSAVVLDDARLNKQIVESYQISQALTRLTEAYQYHPATLMWAGAEQQFLDYVIAFDNEWIRRGRTNIAGQRACEVLADYIGRWPIETSHKPWWRKLPGFHAAMRGNLVRKKPEHYGLHFTDADPLLEYQWPVRSINRILHYHPKIKARLIPAGTPQVPSSKLAKYRPE